MKTLISVIILSILFVACVQKNKQNCIYENENKYASFSFFNLEGIKKIDKEAHYPFITVEEDSSQSKKISVYLSKETKKEINLKRYNEYSYTFSKYQSKEGKLQIFSLYKTDTIETFVILQPKYDEESFLQEYIIETKHDNIIDRYIKIYSGSYYMNNFGINEIETYKKEITNYIPEIIWHYKYTLNDSFITLHRIHKDFSSNEDLINEVVCYDVKGENYFWLNYMYYETIVCK